MRALVGVVALLACTAVALASSQQVDMDVEPAIALVETDSDFDSLDLAATRDASSTILSLEEDHSERVAAQLQKLQSTAHSLLEVENNAVRTEASSEIQSLLKLADVADDLRSKYRRVISNLQAQYNKKKLRLKSRLERVLRGSWKRLDAFKKLVAQHKEANTQNVATTRAQNQQLQRLQTQVRKAKLRLKKALQKTRTQVNKVRAVRRKWQQKLAKLRSRIEKRLATSPAVPAAGAQAQARPLVIKPLAPGTATRLNNLRRQAMKQRRLRRQALARARKERRKAKRAAAVAAKRARAPLKNPVTVQKAAPQQRRR